MQTSLFRKSLLTLALATPLFVACKKDQADPTPDEDNEQITTVTYTLTPATGGPATTITWEDLDGEGGNPAVISPATLNLVPNTVYTGSITILDKTKTPIEDVTEEINEKKDEHLFVYTPSPAASFLTITRTDKDSKGYDVGLKTTVATGAAATGTLQIVLRHQPGVKNGTATPGTTDVDVTFPVQLR